MKDEDILADAFNAGELHHYDPHQYPGYVIWRKLYKEANGVKIETAEKMCLQFLQMLGNLKAQQEAQKAIEESVKVEEVPVEEVPTEQPLSE